MSYLPLSGQVIIGQGINSVDPRFDRHVAVIITSRSRGVALYTVQNPAINTNLAPYGFQAVPPTMRRLNPSRDKLLLLQPVP